MINNYVAVGRLTKDLVLKKTSTGKSTVAFTIACDRDKNNTDFIGCRAYNKTAELLAQYCGKGSQIGLTGSIHSYTTEKNGQKEYHQEVLVDSVTFLDSKSKEQETVQEEPTVYIDPNSDLPF